MKDYGNNPDWFTDAGGNRYHGKPTAARMPQQGGPRPDKVDRLFDGIYAAIVVGVCIPIAFAMVGMLRSPEPAIEREAGTIECQR